MDTMTQPLWKQVRDHGVAHQPAHLFGRIIAEGVDNVANPHTHDRDWLQRFTGRIVTRLKDKNAPDNLIQEVGTAITKAFEA